jgi:hypothetical protein
MPGRPLSVSDDAVLLLALWARYLAPPPSQPPKPRSNSALATRLLSCRNPAVRGLLGTISHSRLRARLRELRAEIDDPYRELVVLAEQWAQESRLPTRPPSGTIQKHFSPITPAALKLVLGAMVLRRFLRDRLKPADFAELARLGQYLLDPKR